MSFASLEFDCGDADCLSLAIKRDLERMRKITDREPVAVLQRQMRTTLSIRTHRTMTQIRFTRRCSYSAELISHILNIEASTRRDVMDRLDAMRGSACGG